MVGATLRGRPWAPSPQANADLFALARERPNLPLEGKGDREAVDEVYDGYFRFVPHFSAHPEVEFRKSGQAGNRLAVLFLHLISHLPSANASFPSRGSLGCISFCCFCLVRFFAQPKGLCRRGDPLSQLR